MKAQAHNVVLPGEIYRKGFDGLLLKCLSFPNNMEVMKQVHEGLFQFGVKMRWLIRRHNYFWPTILKDYITYFKDCQQCQRYGSIQRIPVVELHSIVKPWSFKGWDMDLIRKIHPTSLKGHNFILVATDYFTKWVKVVPLKKAEQKDVIQFFKEHIIHRFEILQSITTDQGTMLTVEEMNYFAAYYGIQLIISTHFYSQANG